MADLSFIIVFGTRWHFKRTVDGWDGTLNCPVCKVPTQMIQQHAFKAFTLYWWPLFRTEDGGELLQCVRCRQRFELLPELSPEGSAVEEEVPEAVPDVLAEPMPADPSPDAVP